MSNMAAIGNKTGMSSWEIKYKLNLVKEILIVFFMLETENDSVKVQDLNPGEEAVVVDSSYHSLKISMIDMK